MASRGFRLDRPAGAAAAAALGLLALGVWVRLAGVPAVDAFGRDQVAAHFSVRLARLLTPLVWVSSWPVVVAVLVAAAASAAARRRTFRPVWAVAATVAVGVAVTTVLKILLARPGPTGVIPIPRDGAWPSGHVVAVTLMASVLVGLTSGPVRRWAWGLLVLPVVVAMALVYRGDHWLTDVTAGLLLGGLLGAACSRLSGLARVPEDEQPGPADEATWFPAHSDGTAPDPLSPVSSTRVLAVAAVALLGALTVLVSLGRWAGDPLALASTSYRAPDQTVTTTDAGGHRRTARQPHRAAIRETGGAAGSSARDGATATKDGDSRTDLGVAARSVSAAIVVARQTGDVNDLEAACSSLSSAIDTARGGPPPSAGASPADWQRALDTAELAAEHCFDAVTTGSTELMHQAAEELRTAAGLAGVDEPSRVTR